MSSKGFNRIVRRFRKRSDALPDLRKGKNIQYRMSDPSLSAFATFFHQSPSFLARQKYLEEAHGRSNAQSFFQVGRIPSDNLIRKLLDPIDPCHFYDWFDDIYQGFEQEGILQAMRAVEDTQLIALDGTWYFSSQSENIHCERCSCIHHQNGKITHFHSAITPVIVSPGYKEVVSLKPEFIVKQDGHEKQDCEINAAKRWLGKHAQQYAQGNSTLLGDDIYAHQPFCRQALLHGFHFLFTCKPSSHTYLAKWVEGLESTGQTGFFRQRVKGKQNRWETREYRWAQGVPLTDDNDSLKVNWLDVRIIDHQGEKIYHNSWITDWEISQKNIVELVSSARARWKIENENNNVLKNRGYHLKHNFGHGKEHLSSVLLTLNLLAFALHTLLYVADDSYRLIRDKLPTRRTFFEHVRALTYYQCFDSWENLLDFMMRGLKLGPYAKKA